MKLVLNADGIQILQISQIIFSDIDYLMQRLVTQLIRTHRLIDTFYVVNLNVLDRKIKLWKQWLPNVQPFYAMKCNPDPVMMQHMMDENFGFDCASRHEYETVLNLGCQPRDIIFAHPVKKIPELLHAVHKEIQYVTFDSLSELVKIKKSAPYLKCIMRLHIDNPSARVQLGLKYGIHKSEIADMLHAAREMNLNLVGTSFHVGSASKDPQIFKHAIDFSRDVFENAKQHGFASMNVLDIGGGFTKDTFKESAIVLRQAIEQNFTPPMMPKIIAEPGRFFAEETCTLVTPVLGYKTQKDTNHKIYYISESLYGSFNCILYDGQDPTFEVIRNPLLGDVHPAEEKQKESVIYGSTCDSADKLVDSIRLPNLRVGDFMMIPNFGAYTISGAKDFNGINFTKPRTFYVNHSESI